MQNEPEAAVGWEACLYTAEFMASFVRDYLGPTLEKEHPGVKIIGCGHTGSERGGHGVPASGG